MATAAEQLLLSEMKQSDQDKLASLLGILYYFVKHNVCFQVKLECTRVKLQQNKLLAITYEITLVKLAAKFIQSRSW